MSSGIRRRRLDEVAPPGRSMAPGRTLDLLNECRDDDKGRRPGRVSDGRVDPVAEIQASAPERPIRQRPCGSNTWWGICLPSRQEVDDGSSATVAGRRPRSHRGQPGRPRHPATRDSARLGRRAGVASLLPGGLSVEDAAARLESTGPNELPTPHGPSLPRQFAEQLIHFFALMLWVAAGLAFVGGMPALGVAIVVVIVVNGAFSFLQEYRPSGRCAPCQPCSRRRSSCAEGAASARCRPRSSSPATSFC